eukprot:g9906.t1
MAAGVSGDGSGSAKWDGASPGSDDDDIIPRDIRFGILANPTRHWLDGDFHKTALIDGLSIFLPEGERYFIRSLKHYAGKLNDKQLLAEINGYAVQEAFHTREHEEYNRALSKLGYDVEAMEEPVRQTLRSDKIPIFRLAVTCAIEHLTATLSTVTLRNPQFLENAAPAYRRLWMWHALEELEHKAVALDVLAMATRNYPAWKRYLLRTMAFNAVAANFLRITLRNLRLFAQADGIKTGPAFWLKLLWVVFGAPGYWRKCAPLVLKYYMPGFNPLNKDDQILIRKGRDWLYSEFTALKAQPKWVWRRVYNLLSLFWKDADWRFMNYGYLAEGSPFPLKPEDEPERVFIGLYQQAVDGLALEGAHVLEVGSGRGGGSRYIARYYAPASVTGMDYSPETVRRARRLNADTPGLSFENGDAELMPFADGSFDLVVNIESSHCYGDVPAFSREVARVLRPGGWFTFADMRPKNQLATLDQQLAAPGLELVSQHNITPGVLAALDAAEDRKSARINRSWGLRRFMSEFSGSKGSVLYKGLKGGSVVYVARRYRKTG